ncbi:MAG: MFS transporter [Acidimicrobiales bacterium]|nr:MFS transporter [Acidimicrobiales bacterium]
MRVHRPTALLQLETGVGHRMARLSGLEGFARSMLVGTVPLVALERLGSKGAVSQVYTVGAVLALMVTLNLGTLERLIQRRWVATLGLVSLYAAALLFIPSMRPTFVAAVALRSAAASIFSVCLTLYIMDYIGKRDLSRNESRRMVANGMAWLVGPSLGIFLWQNVDESAPFILSSICALITLAYFWKLRLEGSVVLRHPTRTPDNPLRNIKRYFGQRHLRIAYSITLVRAMFWVSVFVYGPIYIVEAGFDETVAGLFLSAIAALLFLSPAIRAIAEQVGNRKIIVLGFTIVGSMMITLGALGEPRKIGVAFWMLAASGGVCLDVLGNIPFMRTVKPRERTAMATVFSTWREMSEFTGPLIGTIVVALSLPFNVYYVILGLLALGTGGVATFLPRRI